MKRMIMAGLAALLLGGVGFVATQDAQAGCRGGSCGSRGYYSGGYYSGGYSQCGPGGCYAPTYRNGHAAPLPNGGPPPAPNGSSPSDRAYRAPGYRPTYAYRTQTYYRGPRVYTGGRSLNGRIAPVRSQPRAAAQPAKPALGQGAQAQLQLNAPQQQPSQQGERFNPASPAPERRPTTPPAAPKPDDNDQGRSPPPQPEKKSNP